MALVGVGCTFENPRAVSVVQHPWMWRINFRSTGASGLNSTTPFPCLRTAVAQILLGLVLAEGARGTGIFSERLKM